MALFRRPNTSFDDLVAKLKNPATISFDLFDEVLVQVTTHPDATPKKLAFMLSADNPKIRDAGFAYLSQVAGRDCGDLMVEAIGASPLQRRREMAQMLWKLDRQAVVDALRRAFTGTTPTRDLRPVVLEIIGYSASVTDFLGPLKTALRPESSPQLRRVAVRQLRRSATDPTVHLLLKDLAHDDDETVRGEALVALCERPSPDLVEMLFARLPQEKKDVQRVIGDALAQLTRTCAQQMEEPLFTVLADEDPEARTTAARLIADLPDADGVLRRFLEFNRGLAQWLRERALDALVSISEKLTQPLGRLMLDADPDLRMASMLLAARWNHPSIVPHVTQIWQRDKDWWSCSVAADILARFPSPETFATLMRRADDPDLRLSVVHAMRGFETEAATEVLLRHIGDPERSVRCTALEGLRGRGGDAVARGVFALAQHDPELQVRQIALEVLRTLGAAAQPMVAQVEQRNATPERVDLGTIELEMENGELTARRDA
ncbi:MAG: HEAT repeat domain-containing protein [Planctomycetota bacterium]